MDRVPSSVVPAVSDRCLEVWMDGSCRVCRASRAWVEARASGHEARFLDFRTVADDQLPVRRDELERSMWVRTPDGRLLRGFAAWRTIVARLPRWGWLARLTARPPLSWVGERLYRFIARWRHVVGSSKVRPSD
jgi:predicted DCC family thiol-disulfide oxidoreductase YuxK